MSEGGGSQWLKRAREGGAEALCRRVAAGPTPKLSEVQRAQLPVLPARWAQHHGFRGELWTLKRVAELIERELGVRYHWAHVAQILKGIGWNWQKPVQRDEQAIAHWRDEQWTELKKATAEERTIVFVDEADFHLIPGVVRTFAPRGQTPCLRGPLTRDHLSAISAITPEAKLIMQVQAPPFKGVDIVRFLRHLPGKLVVIWGGLPVHRTQR